MKLFDTHTHLNASQFDGIETKIVERALEQQVAYLAVVGFDAVTIEKSLQLSEQFRNIVSVVGWHPTEAISYTPQIETQLQMWLEHPNVRMLGEIGLDYYWDTSPVDVQKNIFRRQIAIAKEHGLPITIHNRDATDDVYRILKQEGVPQAGGIMHSFGGNAEQAMRFVELGMHISFSGVLTFKKSEEMRQAALVVPYERLLIETDAPYLAPVPFRGKQNEPAYVRYVAEELARIRQLPLETIANITTENAFNLFGWRGDE